MKNRILAFSLILVFFAIHGCTDPVSHTSTISLEMIEVIPQTSGTVVSVKGKLKTDFDVTYGFCYSQSHNPTTNDKIVTKSTWYTSGGYNGNITATIDKLSPNETYYFRLFANYEGKIFYSEEMSYTTERVVVTTESASNISYHDATLSASVSCPGNTSISRRGFEYGVGSLDRDWYESSKSTGSYTASLSYLTSATTYYYRAYVIDNYGNTVYGDTKSFTTKDYNDAISIADFRSMSTGSTYYTLQGVIWEVDNSTDGYFYLVDKTGIIPVMGLESFSSLDLSTGDNITIRAQRQTYYVPYARNATLVRQNASWSNLDYTYAIEPTTTQSFNNSYTNFFISKSSSNDKWYRLQLYNGVQIISLWFICDYNSESVIPAGTYDISSSYSKGTIAYSPGFDLNKGTIYNSVFYNNYASADFPKQEVYCLTGGYVKVAVAGSSVTLTIRATTHNGSTVNTSWTGDLTSKYSLAPYYEDNQMIYPLNVVATE